MPRVTLTDAKVRALKPATGRRYDVQDDLVTGLIVCVTPSGHKSFMLKQRFPGSPYSTRRAIGEAGTLTVEQARETARQWKSWLAGGIDPADEVAERKRRVADEQAQTFAVVAEKYIERQLQGRRQGERSAREIRKELVPAWGERQVTAITRGDVIRLLDTIRDRVDESARAEGRRATHAYAHIIYSHCRALFNFAVMRYDLPSSPCDRLKPKDLIGPKKPRERVLSDAELRALWRAAERMDFPNGPMFRLLLLTGVRKSECSDARWREFDLKANTWTVPAARFKSDSEHVVPLTPDVLTLLADLPRFQRGDHLFSTCFGEKPLNGFSKAKARLDRLMQEELGGAELQPFVIHDIRRTVRTRLSALCPERVAEAVIGHGKRGLLRVYDQHSYADEVRAALELWQLKLLAIVSPPPTDNVVPIRAGA